MDKTYQSNDVYSDKVTIPLLSFGESESFSRSAHETKFMTTMLALLFLFTAVFNLIVFTALVCFHKAHKIKEKALDVLVLHLALVDLLLLVPMGFSLYSVVNNIGPTTDLHWPFCRFVCSLDQTTLLVMMLLKVVFHQQRLKNVCSFDHPGQELKSRTACIIAAVCWGIGVVWLMMVSLTTSVRTEYSYFDITCIVSAGMDAGWLMILHLSVVAVGIVAALYYIVRFMAVIKKMKIPPTPSIMRKSRSTPHSGRRGGDVSSDSSSIFHTDASVVSTQQIPTNRPMTRQHYRNMSRQGVSTSPLSPVSHSQQSSPVKGGAKLKKRRTEQMTRSQSDPESIYQDSAVRNETLVQVDSPRATTSEGGENQSQDAWENQQQYRVKGESRKKVWIILTSVLLTCLVGFGAQWMINVLRYTLTQGSCVDVMYRFAYVGKLLFYLVGVTNPVLYALYRRSMFQIVTQPSCECWYCRLAAWLQTKLQNRPTPEQEDVQL